MMKLKLVIDSSSYFQRPNYNSRKQRKFYSKQELLRNFNAFAENLFQVNSKITHRMNIDVELVS